MKEKNYLEQLNNIKGKTIGIVYIYEDPESLTRRHYDAWEGDVLSNWIHAVYELRGLPLVMDVETFVTKMANNSLPPLDYVVNLSNGFFDLPSLGLVPSLCSYNSISCIPCSSELLLMGENKPISNLIASNYGFQTPKRLFGETETSITRPYNLGSSKGVYRGRSSQINKSKTFIQEFIPGFDTTIPVLYNPLDNDFTVLPAVGYLPSDMNPQWFLGERQKATHSEYKKCTVSINDSVKKRIIDMIKEIGITTYCRLDFRTKCDSDSKIKVLFNSEITLKDLYFIEINPLPTIKDGINFFTSLKFIDPACTLSRCLDYYRCSVRDATLTGFVLSCSIIAIKAMH